MNWWCGTIRLGVMSTRKIIRKGPPPANIDGAPQYCGGLYTQLLFDNQFETSYTFSAGPNFDPSQLTLDQLLTLASVGEIGLVDVAYVGVPSLWTGATGPVGGQVLKVLNGNNSCAAFFNSSMFVQLNQSSALASLLPTTAAAFFSSDFVEPSPDLPPSVGAAIGPGTGPGKVGAGAVIGVNMNQNGAFLGGFAGFVGPFATGQPGAQIVMLLHELAHTLLLLPPDSPADVKAGFPTSQANTQTILNHCLKAVQAVLKGS